MYLTLHRQQSKMFTLLTNLDQKSIETEFLIAICRLTGNKWQSKTLFLAIFDQLSSIVKSIFDCRLFRVYLLYLYAKFLHLPVYFTCMLNLDMLEFPNWFNLNKQCRLMKCRILGYFVWVFTVCQSTHFIWVFTVCQSIHYR